MMLLLHWVTGCCWHLGMPGHVMEFGFEYCVSHETRPLEWLHAFIVLLRLCQDFGSSNFAFLQDCKRFGLIECVLASWHIFGATWAMTKDFLSLASCGPWCKTFQVTLHTFCFFCVDFLVSRSCQEIWACQACHMTIQLQKIMRLCHFALLHYWLKFCFIECILASWHVCCWHPCVLCQPSLFSNQVKHCHIALLLSKISLVKCVGSMVHSMHCCFQNNLTKNQSSQVNK